MIYDKKNKAEQFCIQHFVSSETGDQIQLNTIAFDVTIGTSVFAVAAMMKGLEEYYYKPGGMKTEDQELVRATEHNVKMWEQLTSSNKKSKIIL